MYNELTLNLQQLANDLENGVAEAAHRVPEVLGRIYSLTRADVDADQVAELQREVSRVQNALKVQRRETMDAFKASRKKVKTVRRFANLSSPLRGQRLRKRA
jgi:hypothetical protein